MVKCAETSLEIVPESLINTCTFMLYMSDIGVISMVVTCGCRNSIERFKVFLQSSRLHIVPMYVLNLGFLD